MSTVGRDLNWCPRKGDPVDLSRFTVTDERSLSAKEKLWLNPRLRVMALTSRDGERLELAVLPEDRTLVMERIRSAEP